jgi:hypothetical protein
MCTIEESTSELISTLSWDDYVKALEAHRLKVTELKSLKGFKVLFRLRCWRKKLVLFEVGWAQDDFRQFVIEKKESVRVEWGPWQPIDGYNEEVRYLQVRHLSICRPESVVIPCELEAISKYMQLPKHEIRPKSKV